jgi:hypothetical protein
MVCFIPLNGLTFCTAAEFIHRQARDNLTNWNILLSRKEKKITKAIPMVVKSKMWASLNPQVQQGVCHTLWPCHLHYKVS